MKTLCITGILQPDLDGIADLLQQAGMRLAKSAKHDDSVDIALWHQQIIASAHEEAASVQPIEHPGRLWEQLAGEIFLANLKSKLWGWADARSVWLLDFWVAFESRINFVLVATSPERMLAAAIESGKPVGDMDHLMADWQAWHQEMLRFYHRHASRCLLVDAADALTNPAELMRRCNAQWKMSLDPSTSFSAPGLGADVIAMHLAQEICRGYQTTASLQSELEATMLPLGKRENGTLADKASLIAEYHRLKDRGAEAEKLAGLQAQLEESRLANELLASQLDQAKAELAQRVSAEEFATAQTKLKDAEQENELLLLQLHQVQEELESVFLKSEERQSQIDTLTEENYRLKQANDEATLRVSADELSAAQTRLKDAEQENELLLLQLHQVQEELEHYFLRHQEAQQKLRDADARWQRMLQRSPDYIDYASISASADEGDIHWCIENLDAAGRNLPLVEFDMPVEQDSVGYRFAPSRHPLVRWPSRLVADQALDIIPTATEQTKAERLENFLDLSTSDWDLLQALNRLIKQTLSAPEGLANAKKLPLGILTQGLDTLDQVFSQFPPVVRYDSVGLKREQVNPDYEHLWLRLSNLSFAGQRWPEFEFRLSCANVRPKKFGGHPKLEFPAETGQAPFEAWFDESYDDFGAKFELRFALPDAMDMAVWGQISERDRLFLKSLVQRLPSILATLERDGTHLKRAWKDWVTMAEETHRILALHGG